MGKLLFLIGIILFPFLNRTEAQTGTITGTVTDSKDGTPLQGVTVRVKGGGTVITAFDGSFTIRNAKPEVSIDYTFVGYSSKTVKAKPGSVLKIDMETDAKALSEIVVTGVGVATSKKKLGISVESVTAEKLPAAPTASVDQALIGKIAGAQISSTNGSPGAKTNILLRGVNTLNRGTSPMILLDGMEVGATDLNSLDLSGVERIEVVQGAASATIYGAQGANGVIQLFSKKGKPGKISIDFSSSASSNTLLNIGNLHKSAFHSFATNANNDVVNAAGVPLVLDPIILAYKDAAPINLIDTGAMQNKPYNRNLQYVDHFKMFLQTAYTTNNSIAVSGARDKIDFNISASDNRQNSNFKGNGDYSRSNLLTNIGIELSKNLKFRSITQLVYTKNTQVDQSGRTMFFSLNNSRPFANYNLNDSLGNHGIYYGDVVGVNSSNPNFRTQYTNYKNVKIDVVQSFNLNYKPVKFVELDAKYGLNYQTQDVVQNILPQDNNANAAYKKSWRSNYFSPAAPENTGEIDNYRYRTTFQNILGTATFRTDFKNDFNINIPLQTTTQVSFDYRKNMYNELITWGADAPSFRPYTASQMITFKTASDYTEPFITYGYLVNQRFEIGEYAGISAGLRSDYSSAFGLGSKPFTFPRGDAYLRLSSFNFWSDSRVHDIVPEFKLRAAYGQAGIQPKPFDRYVTLNTQGFGNNVAFVYPTTSSNPNLDVEVSKEFEIGTDIALNVLKGAWFKTINLSATYWNRTTDNAIYNVDVAPSSGLGALKSNAFGLGAKGLQASLNVNVLSSKDLTWNFTTNFSKETSVIRSVVGSQIVVTSSAGSSNYVLKAGDKVGQLYGYMMIHSLEEKDPNGVDFIAKANQGNYTIASNGWVVNKVTKQPFVSAGQYALGDPNPKFNMSFINDFSYKGFFNISMQWDWINGSNLYNQTKEWMYRDGIHGDYANPLTIDGQTGAYTAFYRGVYAQVTANGTKNYFLEDASFGRLRNLSVALDIARLVKIPGFRKLQLILSGRNLVTFTKYTGMDPEVSSGTSNSAFDRGVDHNTIPNIKSYQVGINLGF